MSAVAMANDTIVKMMRGVNGSVALIDYREVVGAR